MDEQQWHEVDRYLSSQLLQPDAALERAEQSRAEAGMPDIAVSALYGRLLTLLARLRSPRRILEIGTLAGYSTICLARGLAAEGELISLERHGDVAEIARRNLAEAGFTPPQCQVRVGQAADSLEALADEGGEPFELVFIDADKRSNPSYLEWAVRLGGPGTLIVLDNVVRGGGVLDAGSDDADLQGTREALALLGSHPRLEATALQTVGVKNWDGFALALVR